LLTELFALGSQAMNEDSRSNDKRPEQPPEPKLPQTSEEILREVERLKRAPVSVRCFGMSLTTVLLFLTVVLVLWYFLR
jgi:hypothetical protein